MGVFDIKNGGSYQEFVPALDKPPIKTTRFSYISQFEAKLLYWQISSNLASLYIDDNFYLLLKLSSYLIKKGIAIRVRLR